ncbi:Uncharacterised protein [uncultured archaeon]|nr:Uncharacterised protein [uncultured archaeon]
MSEETDTSKMLESLTAKVEELTKIVCEKKDFTEGKIRENPLAYVE